MKNSPWVMMGRDECWDAKGLSIKWLLCVSVCGFSLCRWEDAANENMEKKKKRKLNQVVVVHLFSLLLAATNLPTSGWLEKKRWMKCLMWHRKVEVVVVLGLLDDAVDSVVASAIQVVFVELNGVLSTQKQTRTRTHTYTHIHIHTTYIYVLWLTILMRSKWSSIKATAKPTTGS